MPDQTSRLKLVAEFTDKATGGLKKVGGGIKDLEKTTKKSGGQMKNALKGVAIGLAAVATAAIAAKQVFDFANAGANLLRLEQAGEELASGFDTSMAELVGAVQTASRGTISASDAVGAANRAMMLGVATDAETMASLMQVAMTRGRAMGLSTQQAFDDIVTGLGRASPMILDNLGIILDSTQVYEDYAKTIGKSADSLTKAEKTQALVASTIKGAKAPTEDLAETFEQLGVLIKDATDNLKKMVAEGLAPVIQAIIDNAVVQDEYTSALETLGMTAEQGIDKFGVYAEVVDRFGGGQKRLVLDLEATKAAILLGGAATTTAGEAWEAGATPIDLYATSVGVVAEKLDGMGVALGGVTTNLSGLAASMLEDLAFIAAGGLEIAASIEAIRTQAAIDPEYAAGEQIKEDLADAFVEAEGVKMKMGEITSAQAAANIKAQLGGSLVTALAQVWAIEDAMKTLESRGLKITVTGQGGVQREQYGGTTTVPPGYPNDSFLFGASSGERVNVDTAPVAGQTNITNNNQQIFPDATINEAQGGMREIVFDYIEEFLTG